MKYNWPDRIKFVLVNALVNIIIGIAIALFVMSQEFAKKFFSNLKEIFLTGIVTSALLTLPIFINEWKKLRRQEDANEFPDMQNPRNLTSFQAVVVVIDIILLFTGVFTYALYSKLFGTICFLSIIPIWLIDKAYCKKRMKKIQESQCSTKPVER